MLSRDEASATLKDIEQTEGRSSTAYGYKSAAPFLILWGLIWFFGYGATDLRPAYSNWAWAGLIVFGFAASAVIGKRGGTRAGGARHGMRIMAAWLVGLLYMSAVIAVMQPVRGDQIGAFIPLLIAFIYGMMGIWGGARFIVAGAAVAILTLGGFFWLPSHFGLWMAFVGGGTLIATGFWLRQV